MPRCPLYIPLSSLTFKARVMTAPVLSLAPALEYCISPWYFLQPCLNLKSKCFSTPSLNSHSEYDSYFLLAPWLIYSGIQFSQFSHSVLSNSLWPHVLQHTSPSPTPGVYSNSCPSSQWCHPIISSSVVSFSSCPQSFPASGSFQMSQFFASGGQSIGVSASASVLPVNIQDWFPPGWTGWISLQSKGLSRVFSNITVQKHQLFGTQLSL